MNDNWLYHFKAVIFIPLVWIIDKLLGKDRDGI